jgi:hypothetical protein
MERLTGWFSKRLCLVVFKVPRDIFAAEKVRRINGIVEIKY